jgi:hypothetical protein
MKAATGIQRGSQELSQRAFDGGANRSEAVELGFSLG